MNIGSENKTKVVWASALGAIALLVIAYELFSGPSAPVTAAQPTTTIAGKAKKNIGRNGKERPAVQERLDKEVAGIARGEVVVIDEEFGLRITHVVSPKRRLDAAA